MNDPKVEDALRRLAERGTHRGADRVLEDARNGGVSPFEGRSTTAMGTQTTLRTRYAVAAALIAVVVIGGVVATLRDDRETTVAAGPSNFCDVMATSAWISDTDVLVHVDPEAEADVVAGIAERLDARPEVASIRYVDRAETWQKFNELFEDDEAMLENVRAEQLPTSFEVQLVDREATTKAVFRDAVQGTTGVYIVNTGMDTPRVIDVLQMGVEGGVVSNDLVSGALLHLDDVDEGSVPAEINTDLDTVAEALVDEFDDLDRERRVEALRARDRIVSHVRSTCDLPALTELPDFLDRTDQDSSRPEESTATTEVDPDQGG